MTFSTDLFLEYKKRPGRAALARLLERHQDAVYALCRQVLRHPQDAEDACQEVLIEVSRQVDAIEDPERFSGWLYRTALHTALDVKRRRGRQRVREAAAPRASEADPSSVDAREALHAGLADLDDASRQLVVEHYFAQRPLRELAAERGCSEVAVWKRIQNVRERLKKALGSGAVSALDGIGAVHAPGGLVGKALLQGGLTLAASAGLKLAIVAPLVLLAGAGVVMMARRPAPDVAAPETKATAAAVPRKLRGTSVVAPTPSEAPRRTEPSTAVPSRRPYPYRAAPVRAGMEAAARTWGILSSKRVTIDLQDKPLIEIVELLQRESGLIFAVDPDAAAGETVSFKVQDIVLDGCLRLMLQPRGRGYEIRPDGTLHIGKSEDLVGGYEKEARKLPDLQQQMETVRGMLDAGLASDAAPPPPLPDNRVRRIAIPQGETCLQEELDRLQKEHGIRIHVDYPTGSDAGFAAWQDLMRKRFLRVVEERPMGEYVAQLAEKSGLVAVYGGGDWFTLAPEEKARELRAMMEQHRREDEEANRKMASPLFQSGTVYLQDLVDAMSRVSGWEVVPSEEVWNSGRAVTLTPGATVRDGLDALKSGGLRWCRYYGRVFILK